MGEVFARKSSGLVRNISAWETLIFNVLVMAPSAVYIYGIWATVTFPGVYLPYTALVCIPICLIIAIFYSLYSAAAPRSGGDYIWISRTVHPGLGFMTNFFLFIVLISLVGTEIPWTLEYAIAPLLMKMGNPTAAAAVLNPAMMMVLGTVYIVLVSIIAALGSKWNARVLTVSFFVIVAGIVTFTAVFASINPAIYAANFDASSIPGDMTYAGTIAAGNNVATTYGLPPMTVFPIAATFLGVAFTMINFLGFAQSVYIAGEIKDVRRSQFIAILGAVVVFGLLTFMIYQSAYIGMGGAFVNAISTTYVYGSPYYTMPAAITGPWFTVLAIFATNNLAAYFIIVLGFMMMTWAAGLTYVYTCTRLMFSWSFDRILPTKVSAVDTRFGTPWIALIISGIVAFIFMVLWIYTTIMAFFVYIITGWFVGNCIASIAGFIYPTKMKESFELAPDIVRRKIGPFYTIQWAAIFSFIVSAWMAYVGMTPTISGAVSVANLAFTFVFWVIAWIIFAIAWVYHRNRIPLELTFKEIPPE
jgi:amino acid transporter